MIDKWVDEWYFIPSAGYAGGLGSFPLCGFLPNIVSMDDSFATTFPPKVGLTFGATRTIFFSTVSSGEMIGTGLFFGVIVVFVSGFRDCVAMIKWLLLFVWKLVEHHCFPGQVIKPNGVVR